MSQIFKAIGKNTKKIIFFLMNQIRSQRPKTDLDDKQWIMLNQNGSRWLNMANTSQHLLILDPDSLN